MAFYLPPAICLSKPATDRIGRALGKHGIGDSYIREVFLIITFTAESLG